MGFLKKAFKGIKKAVKKIGRGIKKVVGKVGKMFGELGIVGQIGLGLLLPGVGSILSGMLQGVGSGVLASLTGSSNILLQSAGKFIQGAIEVGSRVSSAFSSVTEGVTKVIGETVGAIANKIPGASDLISNISGGKLSIADKNFGSVWETAQQAVKDSVSAGKDIFAPITQEVGKTAVEQAAAQQLNTVSEGLSQKLSGVEPFPLEEIVVNAKPISTKLQPQQSLLSNITERAVTAVKEAPKRLGEAIVTNIEEAPERLAGQVTSGLTTKAMQAAGLEDKPEYSTTYFSGYVPTIDVTQTSDIGLASASQFNPVEYMQNNTESMSLQPIGFNANIYNFANQYKNTMSQYGYNV